MEKESVAINVNVLVVDDVEQNLTAIEALIAGPDVTVLKATSGIAALELLLVHDVALALLDVQMPNMDGFELASLIRGSERTRAIPLIFLTAAAREPEKFFKGYGAGAVDFLYKPIDAGVLQSKVGVFVALDRQKKQLAAQLEELTQALKLNEMFTAVLSHDLRNPLSSVANGAAVLLKMSGDPGVTRTARRIQTTTRRMGNMVEQLLDLARIRSQGLRLNVCSADYAELCGAIVDEMEAAGDGAARIEFEQAGDVQGEVDVDRFSQMISNLVGNAMQHGTPDAPIRLRVDGSAPERITVTVQNGGAIPTGQLPHVFELFRSGENENTGHRGLGLGLFIVKKFAVAHGGDVTATSSPAAGTIFEISMPRALAHGVH